MPFALQTHTRVAFVGAGNMGGAILEGVVRSNLVTASAITVYDLNESRCESLRSEFGVGATTDAKQAVHGAQVVVLAVKPQVAHDALREISPHLAADALVVSVMAALSTSRLEALLGGRPVVRTMPNTPSLLGLGATVYALGRHATADHGAAVETILGAVGRVWRVDESLIDPVSALSGSGPAYVFALAEAMVEGGKRLGIEPSLAAELAVQTVVGAAALLKQSGEAPSVLRQRVSSPGGTTLAALGEMERRGWADAMAGGMEAAVARASELDSLLGAALTRGAGEGAES